MTSIRKSLIQLIALSACALLMLGSAMAAQAETVIWQAKPTVNSPSAINVTWSNNLGRTVSVWLVNGNLSSETKTPYVFHIQSPLPCSGDHALENGIEKKCMGMVFPGTTVMIQGNLTKEPPYDPANQGPAKIVIK